MSSYGLIFKEKHSYNDIGLIMKSNDRSLLPAVKRQQVDIAFQDGKIDLQKEPVYDNRIITVTFAYHFKTLFEMQEKKRQMAAWLSGTGRLVFDDEPNKFYVAKVFESIPIEQSLRRMAVQVLFECQPFAYSDAIMQVFRITQQGQMVTLDVDGNVRTCGKITLRNTGTSTLNNITFSREREK